MTLRTPLLLLALAACDRNPADTPPPPAPEPPPPARVVVSSCPTAVRPVPVSFEPRLRLGDRDGITWLYGQTAQGPALAHLGVDDRLVLTPVALRDASAGALDGPRLWLAAADAPTRWQPVDLTDPERPIPGEVAALTTGAAPGRLAAFAVGRARALVLTGAENQLELSLLDTATGTNVAPPQPLALTFNPLHAFCDDDSCSLVALDNAPEADITVHLIVVRVLADGTLEQERIAADPPGYPRAARHGDRVVVAWPTADGLRLRALDRDGRLLGASVPTPWASKNLHDIRLFQADEALVLAVRSEDLWSVAHVGPHGNPGPLRGLTGATSRALFAAPMRDGLAWVELGDAIPEAELGVGVMTAAWQVEAFGGFLPNTGDPAPPARLTLDGPERADPVPHILTRPGAAAVLLTSPGDAGAATNTFALLRATCPPPADPLHPKAPAPREPTPDETCREAP